MMLRDHPLMTRNSGFCSWPPRWTTTRRDPKDKPTGEIGTLEKVLAHDRINNIFFMFVQYQGCRYMGALQFDDPAFCREIYTLLTSQTGVSLEKIGDIDISYML